MSSELATNGARRQRPAAPVLPHDGGAERHVLGACLLSGDGWATVSDTLTVQDFYEARHQLIFSTLSRLASAGHAIDTVSLGDALDANGALQRAGGHEYLLALTDTIPAIWNVEKHCVRIRELAAVRKVYAAASAIAAEALEPIEDIADFVDRAEISIARASEQRNNASELVHIKQAYAEMVAGLEAQAKSGATAGHRTGLRKVDEYTEGAVPSDFIVIAGRPGMGKTALGMRYATGIAATTGLPVLFFSLEMPRIQLLRRVAASHASIDQTKIRRADLTPEDWESIRRAESDLSKLGVYIDDTPGLSILDIRRSARRAKRKLGELGGIVIDYLQLLRPLQQRRSREEEVGETSRRSKEMAKELVTPVIGLAQLNRGVEGRGDKRPQLSDLRESGAIEQDADTILFVYRDEVYNSESLDVGIAEIIIGKQRNGATGVIPVSFTREFTRFGNLIDPQIDAWKQRQKKPGRGRRSDG